MKLTQEEAAKVFGGGVNAFSKYERGEVTQSAAMDKLIRVAADDQTVFMRLKTMVGLPNTATVINLPIKRKKYPVNVFSLKTYTVDISSNDHIYSTDTSKDLIACT